MATVTERPETRRWADILAIVVGVALFAISLWPSIMATSPETGRETVHAGIMVPIRVIAGVIAIAAVFAAQRGRQRAVARGLLIAAAVLLIGTMIALADFGPWALWTMALPAVLLLASASAVGPLPNQR